MHLDVKLLASRLISLVHFHILGGPDAEIRGDFLYQSKEFMALVGGGTLSGR